MTRSRRPAAAVPRQALWIAALALAATSGWAAPTPRAHAVGLARPVAPPPTRAMAPRPPAPPHVAVAGALRVDATFRGGAPSRKGAASLGGASHRPVRLARHGAAAIDGTTMRAREPR